MGKTYSGLSFDTVYRNLRVMQELGVLEQVIFEDGVKFKAHCSEDHHHHHMICLKCQKTYPIIFARCSLRMRLNNFRLWTTSLRCLAIARTVLSMLLPKRRRDITLTGSTDDEVIAQNRSGTHSGVPQLYLSINAANMSVLSELFGLCHGGD